MAVALMKDLDVTVYKDSCQSSTMNGTVQTAQVGVLGRDHCSVREMLAWRPGRGRWTLPGRGSEAANVSDWDQNANSISECEHTCLANCSCKAFSYVTGIRCLKWDVDLMDIQMFSSGGEDLYIRLARSELDKKKKNGTAIVIVKIVLVVIISLGCICLVWKYKKTVKAFLKLSKGQRLPLSGQGREREGPNDYSAAAFRVREGEQDRKSQQCPLVSFDSLVSALEIFCTQIYLAKVDLVQFTRSDEARSTRLENIISLRGLSKGSSTFTGTRGYE